MMNNETYDLNISTLSVFSLTGNVFLLLLSSGNESMVSLVSRRYIRGENGTESLVVCFSGVRISTFT